MKHAKQWAGWPNPPSKKMDGWVRVGWADVIRPGDCWCRTSSLCRLPNPNSPPDVIGKYQVYGYAGIATAGYIIEKEDVYGSCEVWRKSNEPRIPRKLPMNPVFSKPLPLP